MISESIVWWCLAGALLFWSVGAYNRLVRLRSHASRAFAALAALLQRYAELVQSCGVAQPHAEEADSASTPELQAWAGLYGAQAQFSASLAIARARPLDGASISALGAAEQVLQMAWIRAMAEAATTDSIPLPENISLQWDEILQQARHARLGFAQAIDSYNAAIAQFPAVLLAWVFGFRLAKSL